MKLNMIIKNLKMKVRYNIFLIFILCITISCNSQKKESNITKETFPKLITTDSIENKRDTIKNEHNYEIDEKGLSNLDSLIQNTIDKKNEDGINNIDNIKLKKLLDSILYDSVSSFTRLKSLGCYDTITHLGGLDLKNNKYFIVFNRREFKQKQHRIKSKKIPVYLIDDKPFWGSDFGMPKREFKYIEVYINNSEVDFYKEYYQDLFNPNFCSFKKEDGTNYEYLNGYITKDSEYLFLVMKGGDGAGTYTAIWIFKNKEYHSRIVELSF